MLCRDTRNLIPSLQLLVRRNLRSKEIINHRKRRRCRITKIEYLIFCKGYPTHEMTWEPEENVKNAQEKIAEYYRRVEGSASLKEGRM